MEALVLSCSTGGGHNACAKAIQEALIKHGDSVTFMDPYSLISKRRAKEVADGYLDLVKVSPNAFGKVYQIGEAVSNIQQIVPIHSPVYAVQKKAAEKLYDYLQEHPVDVIFMSHLYPAEMITYLKAHGKKLPLTIYAATDYASIPFTGETTADYYNIPHKDLADEFHSHGIPYRKQVYFGIPTDLSMETTLSKIEAKKALNLSLYHHYILLSGGSFGGGKIKEAVETLIPFFKQHGSYRLLVLCGNNQKLLKKLTELSKKYSFLMPVGQTDKVALYQRASDVFIGKPGGLSSTEACVIETPFIIVNPIPGCETRNTDFFLNHGCALYARQISQDLPYQLELALDSKQAALMKERQNKTINKYAADELVQFAHDVLNA